MREFTISDQLTVRQIVVGSYDNNAFQLLPAWGRSLVIDAADDLDALLDMIEMTPVATIVTTHRHPDHIQALAQLVDATGAEPVAGVPDVAAIAAASGIQCRGVWTGDTIECGDLRLGVIGLVGHTPGSIALVAQLPDAPVHLFTGDALFPGGVGRTTTPEQFASLYTGVVDQLFARFGDDTVVHPGHGADTTLGAERPHLAEWLDRGW